MKKVIFCLICSGLFFISGCKRSEVKNAGDTKQTGKYKTVTVGFSIDTLAMERWQRDLDVFMNKTRELGAKVIVQNAGNSIEEQKRQLLYLADRNVDVVVVLAKSAEDFSESVSKLKAKGIPVICYDRLIRNCDPDLYVTINCEEVGRLMGKGMLEATSLKNWHCILGAKEDNNMNMIQDGLYSAIKGSGVKITETFYTDGWNYDLSYKYMESLITNNSIPEVIICGNDAIAASVLQALDNYKMTEHIPICGQDADIAACKNIANGRQDFTVYKPITLLAEKAAELAVELAKTKNVEELDGIKYKMNNGFKDVPTYWLRPTLVTKDNMEKIIVNSGFHTKAEIYGR